MNKPIAYIGFGLGVALLAYLGYKYYLTPSQIYSTTSLNPNSGAGPFTTSNQQTYPFQANVAPRVDNSNQPWANNNRAALAQVSSPNVNVNLSNANMIANFAKSADDITTSLSSMWDTFGVDDWFSSGDADAFIADVDYSDESSFDWSNSGGGDFSGVA